MISIFRYVNATHGCIITLVEIFERGFPGFPPLITKALGFDVADGDDDDYYFNAINH